MSRPEATPFSLPSRIPGPWPPWLRWSLLAGLLAGELVYLSVNFDTVFLSERENFWTRLAGDAPVFLRIGLASLAAFLVLVFPRFGLLASELRDSAREHGWKRWLLLHLSAYAAFYPATRSIFEIAARGEDPAGSWLAGWLLLGGAVAILWFLALAPLRYWRKLAKREKLALLVAVLAGFAAWGLGELTHRLWRPLAAGTFWLSKDLLQLFYEDVLYDRTDHTLGTPGFMVTIAPACSGYEGIGLITVFLSLYLWLFRSQLRFPQALLLFPLGALAIWLANTFRISALIAIGTSYSSQVALGGFHSQAGWIAFSGIALGLIGLTGRYRLFARNPAEDTPEPEEHPEATALLLPLLVLMGAVMLTSALSHGFDWLYPLRPLATGAVLWRYRHVYRQWDWSWSWPGIAIGVAVFAVWLWLEPNSDGSALGSALEALPRWQRDGWLAFRVVGSVIVVPLAEELAFRGYLLRRLVAADFEQVPPGRFTWLSFLGSSLLFGLVHGRWLAGTLAGMAYAGAVYRRGKLADAVVAHLTTNGLIALTALIGEKWALWT